MKQLTYIKYLYTNSQVLQIVDLMDIYILLHKDKL